MSTVRESFPVGAVALSRFVLCQTPAAAVVTSAATDEPFGIVENGEDANAAQAVFVMSGPTKAIASAVIAKGAKIMGAAAGRVATYVAGAGVYQIGTALEAAGAGGDEIKINLLEAAIAVA